MNIDLDLKENTTAAFYPPFSKDTISTADDKCGHGTHVAGVAAAKHNSFGVVGIAPGARLWTVKVFEYKDSTGKCEGAISSVIQAIDYITKNVKEIDIANLSLGCKCNSTALKEAIGKSAKRAGISSSNLSRMPIIGVRSELRIPMHQNGHHNTIHSFILGIGFIGYEIGL